MKNYLFAPFKDDDDKIAEFNAVVNALNYVVDAEETYHHESALHGLRVFVGRLESYYDVTISELKAENVRLSKASDVAYMELLNRSNDKLQADNKRLYQEHKECRLVEQVSSNSGNSSSTHTIKREVQEYMHHNHSKKAYVFVVDADGVSDDGFIADSHAVSTIHDTNCVAIHSIE